MEYIITLKNPITNLVYNDDKEPLIYKTFDMLIVPEKTYEKLLKNEVKQFVLCDWFQIGDVNTSFDEFQHIGNRLLLNTDNILSVQQFEFFE